MCTECPQTVNPQLWYKHGFWSPKKITLLVSYLCQSKLIQDETFTNTFLQFPCYRCLFSSLIQTNFHHYVHNLLAYTRYMEQQQQRYWTCPQCPHRIDKYKRTAQVVAFIFFVPYPSPTSHADCNAHRSARWPDLLAHQVLVCTQACTCLTTSIAACPPGPFCSCSGILCSLFSLP